MLVSIKRRWLRIFSGHEYKLVAVNVVIRKSLSCETVLLHMTLACLWVCLNKLMLACVCSESHIVREVLLPKMNTHKDSGGDLV